MQSTLCDITSVLRYHFILHVELMLALFLRGRGKEVCTLTDRPYISFYFTALEQFLPSLPPTLIVALRCTTALPSLVGWGYVSYLFIFHIKFEINYQSTAVIKLCKRHKSPVNIQ